MTTYLLSTFDNDDAPAPEPPAPDDAQTMMANMLAIEDEMVSSGTFVFSGRLHAADAATVVTTNGPRVLMTDGPFVESKEHIAGFYVIEADDLDAALDWAARVSACIGRPIEVQPFAGTGRLADQFPEPTA